MSEVPLYMHYTTDRPASGKMGSPRNRDMYARLNTERPASGYVCPPQYIKALIGTDGCASSDESVPPAA